MAIKPAGYGQKAALLPKLEPKIAGTKTIAQPKPYNPMGYVPGGSSQAVSKAIQNYGYAHPGPTPAMIPQHPTGVGAGAAPPASPGVNPTDPSVEDVPFNWGAYLDQINDDPVMKAAIGAQNTNTNSWRRQLESAIRTGVVGGGWNISDQVAKDPVLSAELNNYVSPAMWDEINAAAATNQLSSKATLDRQLRAGQQQDLYAQAARGTLGSGAHAVADMNVGNQNILDVNTAQAQLMDSLRGAQGTYLSNVAQGQQAVEQTRSEVAARLAAQEGAAYDARAATALQAEQGKVPVTGTGDEGPASAASTPGQIGISWGGNPNITTVAELTKILKASGISYGQWRKNHEKAALKLEGMS